jgi:hypothetical protein
MQPIQSMVRRTTHHVARQQELFALRAKKAGSTFTSETREASRALASAVRAEADAWTKYVRERTVVATRAIAPVAIERTLLLRVDDALRAAADRVRRRLATIEGRKRPRGAKAKRASGANGASGASHRRESSASRARARAS